MAGNNMLSWWTNHPVDGEKDWRNRDTEFGRTTAYVNREQLMAFWEKDGACCGCHRIVAG